MQGATQQQEQNQESLHGASLWLDELDAREEAGVKAKPDALRENFLSRFKGHE